MNKQNEIKYPEVNFTKEQAAEFQKWRETEDVLSNDLRHTEQARDSLNTRSEKIANTKKQKGIEKALDEVGPILREWRDKYNLTAIVSPDEGCQKIFKQIQLWENDYLKEFNNLTTELQFGRASHTIKWLSSRVVQAEQLSHVALELEQTIQSCRDKGMSLERAAYQTASIIENGIRQRLMSHVRNPGWNSNIFETAIKQEQYSAFAEILKEWEGGLTYLIIDLQRNWSNMTAWRMLNNEQEQENETSVGMIGNWEESHTTD
jgi:hypothetical protein